ncbi:hypothetical protein H2198_003967 [Neophaeococcomyces mojaviensis]|uniref:Uncharacterized protein n=1 Tax=Neophaeococcomyces mojaviensis TaxID=3383035 RepID=A0ACC3A9V6_9EURO|nr:hypothetical protein H2198_003967 [Knufia sp. JES_112]
MPTGPDLPGLQYRKWNAYISLIRGSGHLVHLFAGGGEDAEKALLVFDLLSALTNFGLQQAVYATEISQSSRWNRTMMKTQWDSSGLNAIAAIGYFGVFLAGKEQPEVAVVGLVILEVGTVGVVVMEGVRFGRAYHLEKKTRLLPTKRLNCGYVSRSSAANDMR